MVQSSEKYFKRPKHNKIIDLKVRDNSNTLINPNDIISINLKLKH